MEIQELCKLGFRCVLSSSQWRYRNSANSGSGVYCRVVSGDTGTLQTRVQVCIVESVEIQELCKLGFRCVLSSSQWRYRNSANSGSGVYCRVVSGDTGTLQTRVQVCIVK